MPKVPQICLPLRIVWSQTSSPPKSLLSSSRGGGAKAGTGRGTTRDSGPVGLGDRWVLHTPLDVRRPDPSSLHAIVLASLLGEVSPPLSTTTLHCMK